MVYDIYYEDKYLYDGCKIRVYVKYIIECIVVLKSVCDYNLN